MAAHNGPIEVPKSMVLRHRGKGAVKVFNAMPGLEDPEECGVVCGRIPESRVRVVAVGLGHVRKDAMELVLSADASIRDLGHGRSEISACTIVQGLPSMGKRIWIWANGQRVLIHEAELHALGVGVDELEVLLAMLQSMGDGVVIVIVTDSLTAWELCCGEKQPDGEEARVVELVQKIQRFFQRAQHHGIQVQMVWDQAHNPPITSTKCQNSQADQGAGSTSATHNDLVVTCTANSFTYNHQMPALYEDPHFQALAAAACPRNLSLAAGLAPMAAHTGAAADSTLSAGGSGAAVAAGAAPAVSGMPCTSGSTGYRCGVAADVGSGDDEMTGYSSDDMDLSD